MAIATLDDLFTDGLRDIYYAEKQILKSLGMLIKKSHSHKLKQALENHRRETEQQVGRLEQVMEMMDEKPRAKKCPGIEGILTEGNETLGEIEEDVLRDAAIVGAAQAVEHYEISRYGTLIAWARQLGQEEAAGLLEETLTEEKAADELLSEIAESEVNQQATTAGGEGEEMGEGDEESEEAAAEGETRTRKKASK